MGCSNSIYEKSAVGWEVIESNHLYVKAVETQIGNPPSTNPNFISPDSSSPHTYIGNPVDITLQVVIAEGLWSFIDVFGAPRLPTNPPVRSLTLDARQTGPGGTAIHLSPDVLNAFFSMLYAPNSQGMELVKLVVQNIVLKGAATALGHAVEKMCNLRQVELFSNGMDDKAVEVRILKYMPYSPITLSYTTGLCIPVWS